MDHIVRAVAAGMVSGASSVASRSGGVVIIVQWVGCMRGMGCMIYHGEEDAEVARLKQKKEKGKTYKSDVGAKDLTAFIEG